MPQYCLMALCEIPEDVCGLEQCKKSCIGCTAPTRRCQICQRTEVKDGASGLCPICSQGKKQRRGDEDEKDMDAGPLPASRIYELLERASSKDAPEERKTCKHDRVIGIFHEEPKEIDICSAFDTLLEHAVPVNGSHYIIKAPEQTLMARLSIPEEQVSDVLRRIQDTDGSLILCYDLEGVYLRIPHSYDEQYRAARMRVEFGTGFIMKSGWCEVREQTRKPPSNKLRARIVMPPPVKTAPYITRPLAPGIRATLLTSSCASRSHKRAKQKEQPVRVIDVEGTIVSQKIVTPSVPVRSTPSRAAADRVVTPHDLQQPVTSNALTALQSLDFAMSALTSLLTGKEGEP